MRVARHVLLVPVLYLLALLGLTWPWATRLTEAVPAGSEPPTLVLFQLYTMEWNARFLSEGGSYWDAPFFYPHAHTFAWSEPQPFSGLLVWLLMQGGLSLTVSYNLVLLAYLVLAGVFTRRLALQVTDHQGGAFLAGLWAVAGTWSIHQMGALHLAAIAFPIALVDALCRLSQGVTPGRLLGIGAAWVLTWLTCAQFGLLAGLALPALIVLGRPMLWAALPVGLGSAALAPFLLDQQAKLLEMGFYRTIKEIEGVVQPMDLLLPARGHWLTGKLWGFDQRLDVYSWSPGLVLAACVSAALLLGWRPWQQAMGRAMLVMGGVALLLCFGPSLRIGAWSPYVTLADVVPGLNGIRSPARFVLFTQLGIGALGAGAISYLCGRYKNVQPVLLASITVLMAAEMYAAPIALADTYETDPSLIAATDWLRAQPAGAVAELPLAPSGTPADLENESRAMRRSLEHGHPVINGYSGHFPEPFWQVAVGVAADPAGRGLRYLQALDVRYILVHTARYPAATVEALRGICTELQDFGTVFVGVIPDLPTTPAPPLRTTSKLRQPPQADTIISARLEAPPEGPLLFGPTPDWQQHLSWAGGESTIHPLGSVIIDAGATQVFFQLSDESRARMVSPERVQMVVGSGNQQR